MARPRIEFSEDQRRQIRQMAGIACTVMEIADVIGCSHDSLTKYCQAELNKGRNEGCASLRRMQWSKAKEGNVAMLIWLGKQMLGQSDKINTINENTNRVITITDVD